MNLKQVVAQIIDAEVEHGDKEVQVIGFEDEETIPQSLKIYENQYAKTIVLDFTNGAD